MVYGVPIILKKNSLTFANGGTYLEMFILYYGKIFEIGVIEYKF